MNDYGTFLLISDVPTVRIVDDGMPNTRTHSEFGALKNYEAQKAKYLYWNADNNVSLLPDSTSYKFPTEDSRTKFLNTNDLLDWARGN
jgi:hypothetical protein